ncbi:hypothetical protein A4X03_0g188 [Tilletia caries]|uniref:Cytochrome P450 n=1 Tax=Tilletia caries TaxID=13290 RepID=A0A8T8TUG7_9BASI|nr:hypothetical protein A4X03_0g188 [Tilletia caries]CAD6928041.1 unnamed protein product [Tilletia caries]
MQFELTLPHITGWSLFLLLGTLFLLVPFIVAVYKAAVAPSKIASYPGPGVRHWFLGSYPDRPPLTGRTVQAIHDSIRQYGRVFGMVHVGRQPVIVVADYAAVTQVLLKSPWPKPFANIHLVRRFVGRGLLGEEGSVHRRQRKVAFPAFTKEAVYAMSADIREKCELLVKRLGQEVDSAPSGEVAINIVERWNKLALDVIAKVGFGYELNALLDPDASTTLEDAYSSILKCMSTGSRYAGFRHRLGPRFEQLGRLIGVREQVKLDQAKVTIADIGRELVERAKAQYAGKDGEKEASMREEGNDLLSLMVKANMSAELKPQQRLSDEELMDMIPTFLFAGHETSTSSLSWTSMALTQPGHGLVVQKRLRQELLAASASEWRTSAQDLDSLPYLDAVCCILVDRWCSMGWRRARLWSRRASQITFPLHYMNCDVETWGPDGYEFRPERWLAEDHEHYSGGLASQPDIKAVWSSLMSFGLGPTNCIGQRVATLELKLGLATVLSEFEFLPLEDGKSPEFDFLHGIVARPIVVGQEKKGAQVPIRIRRARTE